MIQGSFKCISIKFQRFCKEDQRLCQGSFKEVSTVFQGSFKGVSGRFHGSFMKMIRVFQGILKGASREIKAFQRISMVFQRSSKGGLTKF